MRHDTTRHDHNDYDNDDWLLPTHVQMDIGPAAAASSCFASTIYAYDIQRRTNVNPSTTLTICYCAAAFVISSLYKIYKYTRTGPRRTLSSHSLLPSPRFYPPSLHGMS